MDFKLFAQSILDSSAPMLLLAFVLSVFVEGATEYIFGTLSKNVPALAKYAWVSIYVAMVVGVLCCLNYKLDLFSLIPTVQVTLLGQIASGVVVGRGSNYLHDFVSKFLTNRVS